MARTKRTDPHRPGAIIPAEYKYLLSYSLPTTDAGRPVPGFRVNCELVRGINGQHGQHGTGPCCVLRAQDTRKAGLFGAPGKCGVCGACFIYGDIWIHEPTGDLVHLGHDCAHKYELLADRSEYELARGRVIAAAAREVQKQANAEEREAFLADHPGLAEDLALGDAESEHRGRATIGDIVRRFVERRSLSDKQIALVRKLAEEIRNPPAPRAEDELCAAPSGRVEFEGEVVSIRLDEGDWGDSFKMLVKVRTNAGVWKAWGTVPAAIVDAGAAINRSLRDALVGRRVRIRATLAPRDLGFAIMKRPSGSLLDESGAAS